MSDRASAPRTGQVRLAGHVVALSELRAQPSRHSALFAQARETVGYAECLCHAEGRRLVIRLRAGRFHLACWPGEGDQHSPGCWFFRTTPYLTGRAGYSSEAISGGGPAAVRIRLDIQLAPSLPKADQAAVVRPRSSGRSRRAMSQVGLLHYLWEHASLHLYGPDTSRRWADCHAALQTAAAETELAQNPLAEVLHVIAPYRPEHAAAHNAEFDAFTARLGTHSTAIGRQAGVQRRGLVLGELRELGETRYGWRILLRHQRTPLYLSSSVRDGLRRAYPQAFAEQLPEGARRVLLLVVDRTAPGNLTVIDGAAMLTNRCYLPADSSYEVRMADHLIAAGRRVLKPLHYDSHNEVFPDFVLLDTDPPTSVELWGVPGRATYEARKRAKREHDVAEQRLSLEWEVVGPPPSAAAP
ncbi:DUF1173 family protein [Pseudonocardia sp. RS010]|uniref:DUF1173 family protein n=1 Tax=Pseudonocardia sp. RS010 TaxID=3385979 RepID=UPI0039A0EE10